MAAAETAAAMITVHPDYGRLASRIAVSNLQKKTIAQWLWHPAIDYDRDYELSYFAIKTLEKSYLRRNKRGDVVECPQEMWLRVARCIHGADNEEKVLETYNLLSQKYLTHATPTLYNAGDTNQLASCFLIPMIQEEDRIVEVYDTLKRCALVSESAGGIGLDVSEVASLVNVLRLVNDTARLVSQKGRRQGAIAVYVEPWHEQILEFLAMKRTTGASEDQRARDLFYGLWIPDLFMRRVEQDDDWSLMSLDECPGLNKCWGKRFDKLYKSYEAQGKFRRRVRARSVWRAILESQIETGTPYMLYKESCNRKSNQRHLGTIRCSNLCTEIIQYSSRDEIAVCNLASVALNKFVTKEDGTPRFDFAKLRDVVATVASNLDQTIDIENYPLVEAKLSNIKHRPIGIGVQGLADAFLLMRHPFDSEEARALNRQIFENIYYAALQRSCELARELGSPHDSYEGSPASRGILQFDMWDLDDGLQTPLTLDWVSLRAGIARHGLRNSLLVAPMPTASTAQILGNNESIEPYTSNIYVRRVLSGEFVVVNPHLLEDLINLGLWNETLKQQIVADYGSVQKIEGIPQELKDLYRTAWEIPQKSLIEMAADRGRFIDQSQSLNIFMAEPTCAKLTSMHFCGWKMRLKTGMYYLRTRPAVHAVQFTVDKSADCVSCTA